MDLIAILIVAGVALVVTLFTVAVVLVRRRQRDGAQQFALDLAAADQALEAARAADKGWERDRLEEAARAALADARPGWTYESLHLVLVDDRPGVHEDRAEMAAVGGGERVSVALERSAKGDWSASVS